MATGGAVCIDDIRRCWPKWLAPLDTREKLLHATLGPGFWTTYFGFFKINKENISLILYTLPPISLNIALNCIVNQILVFESFISYGKFWVRKVWNGKAVLLEVFHTHFQNIEKFSVTMIHLPSVASALRQLIWACIPACLYRHIYLLACSTYAQMYSFIHQTLFP